ncbi:hypothetical protein IWX46DRAFT_671362 [Phyllosticta citricarpa]|uniref:Uncharacterized protein n=1 Tax=Phyllosticta citricarpa TaxID=55181 RepID=A0ABR1MKJ8_9PEZI
MRKNPLNSRRPWSPSIFVDHWFHCHFTSSSPLATPAIFSPRARHITIAACSHAASRFCIATRAALVRMHWTTLPEVSMGTFVTARHAMFDGGPSTGRACGPRRPPVFGRGAGLLNLFACAHFPRSLTEQAPAVHPFAQSAHSIRRQAPVLKTRETTLLVFRLAKKQSPATPPLPHFADHCSGSLPHVMSFVDSLTAKNSHHHASPHRDSPGYTASFRHLRTTNRLFFANFFSRVFHKYTMETSTVKSNSRQQYGFVPILAEQTKRSTGVPKQARGSTSSSSAGAAPPNTPSVIAAIIRRHRSSPTSVRAPSLARIDAENAREGREARDSITNRRPPSAPLGVLSLLLPAAAAASSDAPAGE